MNYSKICYIYALVNPINDDVRYIGKSVNPSYRYKRHIRYSKTEVSHKNSWITSLLNQGITPSMIIIDIVELNSFEFWEQHYISLFKSWGFNLTNMTHGGENPPILKGDLNPAKRPEVRIALSIANTGKTHSAETRLKLSNAHKRNGIIPPNRKGQKMSKEGVDKMIKSRLKNGVLRKMIYQINERNEVVNVFNYSQEIKKLNPTYSLGNISSVCRGDRAKAYGFFWSYANPAEADMYAGK